MLDFKNILFLYTFFLCMSFSYAEKIDFTKEIQPIFKKHCYKCHGSEKRNGGLALHTKELALGEVDSGEPVIHPGDSQHSHLIKFITDPNPKTRMPRKAPPLSQSDINKIKQWIDEGAQWPDNPNIKKHWAYEPPLKPEVPQDSTWGKNSVDAFIYEVIKKKGLKPNPSADRARLIRRLSLDLTGLPPEIHDVDAFINDPTPHAYEKIVDHFLAKKSFGEKWARSWLDLARYADSDGYQRDGFRDVWPFRDYVIQAMNNDMPFNQFTIEQIAGDLLPNPTHSQLIATAFHRNPILNLEAGTDIEEDRVKQVVDRVNTTGTVWLGTSLVCSQCHNHKYDPISIKEYYQLYSYFNQSSIEGGIRRGVSLKYVGKNIDVWKKQSDQETYKKASRKSSAYNKEYFNELQNLCAPSKQDNKKVSQTKMTLMNLIKNNKKPNPNRINNLVNQIFKKNKDVMKRHKKFNQLTQAIKQVEPEACRVMDNIAKPRETFILKRGNFLSPGKKVSMGVPAILHPMPESFPKNRLGLAKWISSRNNPLVARVTVNRWWHELFGHGIVASLDDFGKQGELPSHPKLIDWLAVEFMENNWSMKHIIKTMVMSATYQQSAKVSQKQLNQDLHNRYFARGNAQRYSAETIRDNALKISGLLSQKMGGPPVKPYQPNHVWRVVGEVDNRYNISKGEDQYRRGIYTIWRRSAPYPSMRNFDAPNRGTCTVKRSISNTPLQALTLLNDEAYHEMSKAFAKKVLIKTKGKQLDEQVIFAFRTAMARQPTKKEIAILSSIYTEEHNNINQNEKIIKELLGNFTIPNNINKKEWAAWFSICSIILNSHETITRN